MCKEENIVLYIRKTYTDLPIYDEDTKDFKPERMLEGKVKRLPKYTWNFLELGLRLYRETFRLAISFACYCHAIAKFQFSTG